MKRSERRKIYSTFRAIIRVAALSSPTTSPIKKQLQEVPTENLKGVSKKIDFDCGIPKSWNQIFTSEDDPDVNVVTFPDIPTPPAA